MVQSKRLMKKVAAFQLSPGVTPCWEVYQKEEMALVASFGFEMFIQ